MPRNPTTGVFTRVDNSFSDPITGTVIDPTDAIAYYNDIDAALNTSIPLPPGAILIGQTGAPPAEVVPTGDVTISEAGITAIGATKITSAMLNADVFSTPHTWSGQQTFVTPILGTPASVTLTNATGLPLAGLNAQAAYTFVGNNTGGSAVPTAVDIAGLTTKASPAAGDYVILSDQAAAGAWKKATVSSVGAASGVSSFNGLTGAVTSSIVIQTFTANGTYTPTAGMTHCIVDAVGGGGGGGGTASAPASTLSSGGGGGGSEYRQAVFSAASIGASQAVTIGAAGAAAVAGNNAGGTGGTTTLGALLGVVGGTGGAGNSGSDSSGGAGAGGTGGGGGFGINGQSGRERGSHGAVYPDGAGGNAAMGFGYGGKDRVIQGTGLAGSGFGGGGAGGLSFNAGGAQAGGAGSAGFMRIIEYIN